MPEPPPDDPRFAEDYVPEPPDEIVVSIDRERARRNIHSGAK